MFRRMLFNYISVYIYIYRRGRDRMVVGFKTTYTIGAYYH
jgi:hypothetical protein